MREQENKAIADAWALKEYRFWVCKQSMRWSSKSYNYGFFTNWKSINVSLGKLSPKFDWPGVPGAKWGFVLTWWPIKRSSIWVWHNRKLVFHRGDWPG